MQKQYQVLPDEASLAEVARDLRFHPTTNDAPKVLSLEEISHFNREGYLPAFPVFDGDEIASIRDYFDELLQKVIAEGGNSYSISSAHLRYGPVYDLLTEDRIVDRVADLLGTDVIAWGSHFFCKMPGDGQAVAWHQDASYWPLTPSKAVTVWLAIDDADQENGCMRFISGSHHYGHLTYRPSDPSEHNVLNQTIDHPEQYGKVVWDPVQAGFASIHSDLLLHGSEANHSHRRRCGLTLRYTTPDVRAGMGWNEKGVWVRGADPSGHWSNRSRPDEREKG